MLKVLDVLGIHKFLEELAIRKVGSRISEGLLYLFQTSGFEIDIHSREYGPKVTSGSLRCLLMNTLLKLREVDHHNFIVLGRLTLKAHVKLPFSPFSWPSSFLL
jgi:hypothetical protein